MMPLPVACCATCYCGYLARFPACCLARYLPAYARPMACPVPDGVSCYTQDTTCPTVDQLQRLPSELSESWVPFSLACYASSPVLICGIELATFALAMRSPVLTYGRSSYTAGGLAQPSPAVTKQLRLQVQKNRRAIVAIVVIATCLFFCLALTAWYCAAYRLMYHATPSSTGAVISDAWCIVVGSVYCILLLSSTNCFHKQYLARRSAVLNCAYIGVRTCISALYECGKLAQ
eukprot:2517642-Rhodomonas_salina.1